MPDPNKAELLDEKEAVLRNEKPACMVERYRRDLSQADVRRELFRELGTRSRRAAVLSEGLVMYLTPENVRALADDLFATTPVQSWILDLYHPRLLANNSRGPLGKALTAANAQGRRPVLHALRLALRRTPFHAP